MYYTQELPLVFYSLLAQMAVGIIFVGQCLLPRKGETPAYAPVYQCVRKQSLVALVLLGVAALICLSRFDMPLSTLFDAFKESSSWLSREMALMGVTALCLLWLSFTHIKALRTAPSDTFVKEGPAGSATWIVGLVLVFAMSSVHSPKGMPGMSSAGVLLSFDASLLLLGGTWMGVALSSAKAELPPSAPVKAFTLTMLGLVVMSVSLPLLVPPVPPVPPVLGASAEAASAVSASMALPYAELAPWYARHAALTGFGVMLFMLATLRAVRGSADGSNGGGARLNPGLCIMAFVMVFAGEVLGRIGFYLTYSRMM